MYFAASVTPLNRLFDLIGIRQNEPDDNSKICMHLAYNFFRGCTVLAFLHSHFDRRLARWSAKEALGSVEHTGYTGVSEAAWTDSMGKLETFLEVMASPSS